jgi:hypothetical protein
MREGIRRLLLLLGGLLALDVGSYVGLSRRGYAEAEQWHQYCAYYVTPENSRGWRWRNHACVYLFRPLNAVDRWLGLERGSAVEPMWGLSRLRRGTPDLGGR